ncbi:MAG: hypothetical protein ACOCYE_14530 [Pseudomonadota bacterium]
MRTACGRIEAGIALVANDERARLAFRLMNLAIARAARRRNAGPEGDPEAQQPPKWRPFQLAFILLNLEGLSEKTHPDREVVDLLFFPTGGGKTEAYLGPGAEVSEESEVGRTGAAEGLPLVQHTILAAVLRLRTEHAGAYEHDDHLHEFGV